MIALLFFLTLVTFADSSEITISDLLHEELYTIPSINMGGEEYISLRTLSTIFDFSFQFYPSIERVLIYKEDKEARFEINRRKVLLDGKRLTVLFPPKIVKDKVYVSVDFVISVLSKILNAEISWNHSERKLIVSRKAFPLVKVAKELRPIVIDPGHGGEETGAVGKGGLWEKDVVLEIARRIKAALNEYGGLNVVLTRDSDQFLPLRARSGIANHKNGMLFVSLHTNAHPSTKINTLRVYFQSSNFEENFAQQNFIQRSKALAKIICEFLDDRLGIRDSKVQKIRSPILKDLMMPAVLVEIGFISNTLFEAELQDDEVKNKVAQSISQAIIEYTHLYERR